MTQAHVVRLDKHGMLRLPAELRGDLPAGTEFVVRRQDRNIFFLSLAPRAPVTYELDAGAASFANELIAENYADYIIQTALNNTDDVTPQP